MENLINIDTGADYTWKKSENSEWRTKKIDYIFSGIGAIGSYRDTESDHRALYAEIALTDIGNT